MIEILELPQTYGRLTLDVADALDAADVIVVQTLHNQAAKEIERRFGRVVTLDDLYDQAESFDELYSQGAERIANLSLGCRLVFATVGAVRSNGFVRWLQREHEISWLGGVSVASEALNTAAPLLGIQSGGYTAIEAREIESSYLCTSSPLVVTGVDNSHTAGNVQLVLAEYYGDDGEFVFCGANEVRKLKLCDVHEIKQFADGACFVFAAQELAQKTVYGFYDLVDIMKTLRGKDGCPWDKKQTHKTLRQYILEEAYETVDAIDSGDIPALYDELGDVLLQIVFHAEVGRQSGTFDHLDVTTAICSKLIGRHPHIFSEGDAKTAEAVTVKWEEIKRQEKGTETFLSVLEDVPQTMGALMRAYKLQKKAGAIGFDWNTAEQAFDKAKEEMDELAAELQAQKEQGIEEEGGDVLFSIINVLRKMDINPEVALTQTCDKFIRRFEYMEEQAGEGLFDMPLDEMDGLWNEAKNKGR